jgi:hypothetical protein
MKKKFRKFFGYFDKKMRRRNTLNISLQAPMNSEFFMENANAGLIF